MSPSFQQAPADRAAPPGAALRTSGASVAARAGLALLLLLGYFVLALGVVGSLAYLTVAAFTSGSAGVISGKLALVTGLVGAAVARAVFAVERRRGSDVDGVAVSRSDQPELWLLVDDVARELAVAPPDDLRFVEDVNAFVHEETRLLGLVAGRRHMGLGLGLVTVLTVDQLRAVVAHELGHYAGGDTRLSALVHRASATIERTVHHLGATSLLGRVFALYARLYQRVSLAVRRRQELRADEGSVRVAGRVAPEAALREAQAAAAAWGFFGDRYVVPLWDAGTAPRNLYAGYRALLDDPVRAGQLEEIRRDTDDPGHPYDSHPPLATRVAHLRTLPDRAAPGDDRPARDLLREPQRVEEAVTDLVTRSALGQLPPERYAYTEPLDPGPFVTALAPAAAALARATAAVDGGPQPAGVGRTLALLEAGRDAALVTALTGDRRDLGEEGRQTDLRNVVSGPFTLAAELALGETGRARWTAGWSGPVRLVGDAGTDLDLGAALAAALDSDGVAGLRPVLDGAGVPLDDGALPVAAVDAGDPETDVVAVWPDLVRGRQRFDGLVTRHLLVLVPQAHSLRGDVRRNVAASYGIGKASVRGRAQDRVRALLQTPLVQLQRRAGVRVLRWDDLPEVGFKAGLATAWVLQLGGQRRPLDRLKADDDGLAPPPEETAALLSQLVGDRLQTSVRA